MAARSPRASTTRPGPAVSDRAVRDALVLAEVTRVHADRKLGRGVYGARKVWHQLRRQGGATAVRCRGVRSSG